MAADVREADKVFKENDTERNEPDQLPLPSHLIVQNQMREIIQAQHEVVARLSQNVSQQESFMKENLMSREEHQSRLEKLQISMLEDYVPREDYDTVVNDLEKEKAEHGQTRGKLMDVTDKLEFALGQIEVLTKQLEREKTAFENAFGVLKTKAVKESSKNQQLENKCQDIEKKYSEKSSVLNQKQDEIKVLERKLREQEQRSKFKVSELEVERQQEKYILSLMDGADKKKNVKNSKIYDKLKS